MTPAPAAAGASAVATGRLVPREDVHPRPANAVTEAHARTIRETEFLIMRIPIAMALPQRRRGRRTPRFRAGPRCGGTRTRTDRWHFCHTWYMLSPLPGGDRESRCGFRRS